MTILYAYDQTDLDSVNFNFWYDNLDTDEFNDDAGTGGYEDNYHLRTTTNDALSLYGFGFARNPGGDMVVGTIQDLGQWAWDVGSGMWIERWFWSGWNADMADFFAAGQTSSWDDDLAMLSQVLGGSDTFYLSEFDDNMRGFKSSDALFGFAGADVLRGNDGEDQLNGGSGDDWLKGGDGKDNLFGGIDNDVLEGGEGDDILRGGAGRDKLTGGIDEDVFEFRTGDEKDFIKDFDPAFDTVDLSRLVSIVSWSDLKTNHMTQDGADVVIDAKFGDLITLQNVDLADLGKDDFVF